VVVASRFGAGAARRMEAPFPGVGHPLPCMSETLLFERVATQAVGRGELGTQGLNLCQVPTSSLCLTTRKGYWLWAQAASPPCRRRCGRGSRVLPPGRGLLHVALNTGDTLSGQPRQPAGSTRAWSTVEVFTAQRTLPNLHASLPRPASSSSSITIALHIASLSSPPR
jgi:hypothetical protein